MKLLNYIENFLTILQLGVFAFILLSLFFASKLGPEDQIDFFSPYFEFDRGRNLLESELNNFLNEKSSVLFTGPEDAVLKVPRITYSIPATPGLRWFLAGFMMVYLSLIILIFHVFKKIIRSVTNQQSFIQQNIQRIKVIGLILLAIPIIEKIVDLLMLKYYNAHYAIKDMTLETGGSFDWTMFILSLLIYTLGFALEQGRSMQEEQELTI